MNYSTSTPPLVPGVGSAETDSRGFDWQSLWSHNSHALYDQRLSEGGHTKALLTRSPSELPRFFTPGISRSLYPSLWTLGILGVLRSPTSQHSSFFLDCVSIKQRPLKLELGREQNTKPRTKLPWINCVAVLHDIGQNGAHGSFLDGLWTQ